ncbi:N-acetylmuramoyl-L-alanine amidase [Fervidibacter sacchari]|uniref:N-acetylmuramoyl-L-alanine amidase n=1 Tax=Candidatus Fervidibacter sacchari TaxID=1448929 RepID=A0ABT2EJ00_9BACT|nr:N-acetylmuramoyl-L-alanine amidase [Candidatus Fervidibacter sacchari]MCS3917927.1 N-acetylmuramoyl-L-alanine amidase [Candidatus Fervidibacter sacchari]WKU15743.1 N-acetylmuramoyl-L-alanine amidase [Candidatus Fervidibacter sacchari]
MRWKNITILLVCSVCCVLIAFSIFRHRKAQNLPAKDRPVAVIDAGHGSLTPLGIIDVGASHYGLKESEIVLDIALRTQRHLEAKGWVVVTTRDGPWTPFTLSQRSKLANSVQADVFVSLHLNSHTSRRAHGLMVFYWRPEDKQLAEMLQNRLSEKLGLRNRGIKAEPFAVLVWSPVPAVLIELAFISNRYEARRLSNPQFREKAAKALSDVLDEWHSQKQEALQ